jgi:hypothetical protein
MTSLARLNQLVGRAWVAARVLTRQSWVLADVPTA